MTKKILYALFIVFVVGILANAGYHIGEIWGSVQGDVVDPTFVQSFLAGPDKVLDFEKDIDSTVQGIVFTLLGIPFLVIVLLLWIVYFLFFGELFRFIGVLPSILATLASIVIAVICLKRSRENKTTTTTTT